MSSESYEPEVDERADAKGPIAWMARNPVAANLLMWMMMLGGAILGMSLKREVFPEVDLDRVTIAVPYPGASPSAVEEGVTRPIEEAVRGLETIKNVYSWTSEGYTWTMAEVMEGEDSKEVLDEVDAALARTSMPAGIERPVTQILKNRDEVITLMIYGDVDERALYGVADWARDGLLEDSGITVVEVSARRAPVVNVELDRLAASRYGITQQTIAQALSSASVELPAGQLDTERGRVLLRVSSRGQSAQEIEQVPLLVSESGGTVRLGDVAEVRDEFVDTVSEAYYNGERAVRLDVYRVGEQRPIAISEKVRAWAQEHESALPPGISMSIWDDESQKFKARIDLLTRNAAMGLLLVLVVLGLFLQARLAFWVTLGIPISFLGAMWALAITDVSINMISLFGFIVALGIVVDDAIVVGEAVHNARGQGLKGVRAATFGAREVASPVVFSVLTTVVAFAPLLSVPGMLGKFFKVVPLSVIPILLLSLVESLLVLPAHLSHAKASKGALARTQQRFSVWVEGAIERYYAPIVRVALDQRYAAFALGIGLALLTWGAFEAGALRFTFFPKIEGDIARSGVQFPVGTGRAETETAMQRVVEAARAELESRGGAGEVSVGTYSQLGRGFQVKGGGDETGDHLAKVSVQLVPADERAFSTAEFTRGWRERVGTIPGIDYLAFDFNSGPGSGAGYDVTLRALDSRLLEDAAAAMGERLGTIEGIYNVDSGGGAGREQLMIRLNDEGRRLGLTQLELARQLDASFRGAEAYRMMRGREEVRVKVRRPESERTSEADLESALVRLSSGAEVPVTLVASITRERSPKTIVRIDGERVMSVSAEIDIDVASERVVREKIREEVLPELERQFPGVSSGAGQMIRDEQAALGSLARGALLALLGIYALMAIAFGSYVQPLIVMVAIPFGVVGAFAGHLLMGYDLSMVSLLGIVALSGVVVNDALVLIVAVNERRAAGASLRDALVGGGVRRFRPIVLTSLTTFGGLAPMILETSRQARFLVPMAISLGFGVLFVTFIALILVPAIYHIVEDARGVLRRMMGR